MNQVTPIQANPSIQADLEILFSKYQVLPVLREQFMEMSEESSDMVEPKFTAEVLAQLYLHRQADPTTLVGLLSPKFGTPQEVADKLLLLCEFDYIDFQTATSMFIVKFDVSQEIQTMLDRYQYPLPMVSKPKPIKKNNDSGYETIKNPVILNGSPYFKDKDLCLDHLNRANSVALSLDTEVAYSAEGKLLKAVRKPGESFIDFKRRSRQSEVFYSTTVDVMDYLLQFSNTMYLTHRYDRRGRCYASGYHVNTQGDDYRKAVIQFANKEKVDS